MGRRQKVNRDFVARGAPIVQDVHPIRDHSGRVVALFSIETSLIQLERHRQRHVSFRRAVEWAKQMCMRGEMASTGVLTPFGEWDGVLFADTQRRVTYLSGIANNLYRRLGYMEDLRGRRLSLLNTSDDAMVAAALESRQPMEREVLEKHHLWIRKVVPVWPAPLELPLLSRTFARSSAGGVIILVHDATEERRKREELDVKTTMVQEVHHRVKNNLQNIAALLRMQARRSASAETSHELSEAVSRIMSVALIHEFLSLDESQTINVRDVCQRIVSQTRQVMLGARKIHFSIDGPVIHLPSQQATACALVINELVQNAMEHGFASDAEGRVAILLVDEGNAVELRVWDDGARLPEDFSLDRTTSLGLQIVRSLVQGDLHGQLTLENLDGGVAATVCFPKLVVSKTPTTTY
jgi:two-component sensor histidine kinase